MLRALVSSLALATLVVPATARAAAPHAPLSGPPFAAFTPQDEAIFIDTATRRLAPKPDGTELRWANDASGAWGTMTLARTFRWRGAECREARGENTAAGRTDPFRLVMCRSAQGEWRIRSATPARRR